MPFIPENATEFNSGLLKLETPLVAGIFITLILTGLNVPVAETIMMIFIYALALIYVLTSVIKDTRPPFFEGLMDKIAACGKGGVLYTINSYILNDSEAHIYMICAIGFLVAGIIFYFIKTPKWQELKRPLILLIIGLAFYFMPGQQLQKFHIINSRADSLNMKKE